MHCEVCGRPLGNPCSGCRTLGRLQWLWSSQVDREEVGQAVSALRDCAGVLADLAEVGAGRKKSPKLPEAPSAGEGSTPGAQSGVKEEQPEKDKGPGQVEGEGKDPVIAPKVEDPKPKDEKAAEDEGYYSEEEEEESGESRSITGDEVEAPTREKEPQPIKSAAPRRESLPEGRTYRGSIAAPLGLRTLPKSLSPRDEEDLARQAANRAEKRKDVSGESRPVELNRHEDKKREKQEERRRERKEGRRRSPQYPPGGWEPNHQRRERSRSRRKKDKKNKGKKKRERGREWRRATGSRPFQPWPQRQRQEQRQRHY